MSGDESLGEILIVDDTIANLKLLAGMLRAEGYSVRPVSSGALALRAAAHRPPDLVLLDINMPEMNGYEVCQKFKEDPLLAGVPIIFISALSELEDKVKAFSSGGVDYVTKPFQIDEVRARVETHLRIRRLQTELEVRNEDLNRKNDDLRKLQELQDGLLHLIVHDLRAPLSGMLLSLGMLEEDLEGVVDDTSMEDLRAVADSARLLASMVNDLLDINRMEAGEMPLHRRPTLIADVVDQVRRSLGGLLDDRTFEHTVDPSLMVDCDGDVMRRVLTNLVDNALKHTPRSATVQLVVARGEGSTRIEVVDNGPGIPIAFKERVFEKFGQVTTRRSRTRSSTGLGLTFCKLAVEAHGGTIGLESELGVGATFWIDLPDPPPSEVSEI